MAEAALGPDHPDVAATLDTMATFYSNAGYFEKAEPRFRRSMAIYAKISGEHSLPYAAALEHLAQMFQREHRDDLAAPLLVKSKAIQLKPS